MVLRTYPADIPCGHAAPASLIQRTCYWHMTETNTHTHIGLNCVIVKFSWNIFKAKWTKSNGCLQRAHIGPSNTFFGKLLLLYFTTNFSCLDKCACIVRLRLNKCILICIQLFSVCITYVQHKSAQMLQSVYHSHGEDLVCWTHLFYY